MLVSCLQICCKYILRNSPPLSDPALFHSFLYNDPTCVISGSSKHTSAPSVFHACHTSASYLAARSPPANRPVCARDPSALDPQKLLSGEHIKRVRILLARVSGIFARLLDVHVVDETEASPARNIRELASAHCVAARSQKILHLRNELVLTHKGLRRVPF